MARVPLDSTRLQERLDARWSRIEVVDSTASTNAELLADSTAPDRSVLVAEDQVAGRGRFDRSWTSPPRAGLTFSVLLRPPVPVPSWGWLPLLAGVAMREAVDSVTGIDTALKWPNDLLAGDGRKLAGILAQTAGTAVVIGIGLNVDTAEDELPVDTATSVLLAGAADVDRTALLIAILNRLDARYAQWGDCGGDAAAAGLPEAYRVVCATLGRAVRVTLSDDTVLIGQATDVDDLGRLVVRTPAGERAVSAGDVEHVRSA
ncbi:MAG: biotin--[acetyl-CoA-carboxylase] ligase [Jatrophihabitans sp.]|uniref:biotin--[acetyl-CoA-carboxylase] ligase n=1 Tax=Jatrophihabitans sp. TaxID=1932789 RepID=UPI00390F5C94